MPKKMTIKEALAAGFEYCADAGNRCVLNMQYMDSGDLDIIPLFVCAKERQLLTVSAEKLSEIVCLHLQENSGIYDETNIIFQELKAVNFSEIAFMVNKELKHRWYRATDIELVKEKE